MTSTSSKMFSLQAKWLTCLNFILVMSASPDRSMVQEPSLELFRSIPNDAEPGTVCLQCHNTTSGNFVNVTRDGVIFWHNRRSAADPGLLERDDVTVFKTADHLGIVLNLTQHWEGYYTCGRRVDSANVYESRPKPLICKYFC